MAKSRLEEIRDIRLEKLRKLRDLGLDPYPAKSSLSLVSISQARKGQGQVVAVGGRIWRWREHGQVVFADIKDSSGQIQLLFQQKNLAEKFTLLRLLDVGDFLAAAGEVINTQAGETTLDVSQFELLAKSIRPLPDDWYGLKDVEERYRQRYVDLLLNDQVRQVFLTRTKIVTLLRQALDQAGFVEVETPVMQSIYGGAAARPFTTHHHTLDADFYLRISDELYLKRLVVGGFDKVYEIGKDFRNEGIDRAHNPEFTMLEFYWAYADYEDLMQFTEKLLSDLVKQIHGSYQPTYQNHPLDFTPPWPRLTYRDAILKHSGIDINQANTEEKLHAAIKKEGIKLGDKRPVGFGDLLDTLYKITTRPHLTGPLFLTDRPTEFVTLAKRRPDDPTKTASFQLLAAGEEVVNAYNELNDPQDQAARWKESEKLGEMGHEEHEAFDADYIRALEYGMPPTAGWGLGIDRFTAILTNQPSLKDTILFPTLRPEGQTPRHKFTPSIANYSEYSIADDVKQAFPGISFAFTKITRVVIKKTDPGLERLKSEAVSQHQNLTPEEIGKITPISAYRQMLKQTDVDYHSRRPSPEALLRRIVQGKSLYNINTAVDAYNLAVIETGVGLGGFDLAKISEPVVLRFSQKGEEVHLLGDESKSYTEQGELVYADRQKVLTIDLNYRDINSTKITEKTKDIILFADGGPGIDPEEVKRALLRGANYIQQFCSGKVGEVSLIQ